MPEEDSHADHGHHSQLGSAGGSHSHSGHAHGATEDADRGKLAIALGLILAFMTVEVATGVLAHSLALLSDAGHMLTDAGALTFSIVAIRLAQRPAKGAMTFGLKRVEILSAQVNGMTLLVISLFIIYEAIHRLVSPPRTAGLVVLLVALVGIAVNLVATWTLARANRQSMNVEGSFQHILTDLYAFIGTAIAGGVILATDFRRADAIASLIVAALMLHSSYGLLRASGRVFLEFAPEGLDVDRIGEAMAEADGVIEIHDLHVWEVTSGFAALSAHVIVGKDSACHEIRRALKRMLADAFQLEHTTLQVDHEGEDTLESHMPEQRRAIRSAFAEKPNSAVDS